MNTIPTAEQFIQDKYKILVSKNDQFSDEIDKESLESSIEWMIEFTKLHVKFALEKASINLNSERCFAYLSERNYYDELSQSIIDAYPLENIK